MRTKEELNLDQGKRGRRKRGSDLIGRYELRDKKKQRGLNAEETEN